MKVLRLSALLLLAQLTYGLLLRAGVPATANASRQSLRCRMLTASLAAVNATAGSDFTCKVEMSEKTTASLPYFKELHKVIVEGNGVLEGCLDGSAQEFYVQEYEKEMECLFATAVEDKCGTLPSKNEERAESWEKICLNPKEDAFAAYELMDKPEKAYFYKMKELASERQVYATYLELASYKELVCVFMKTVDDECVAFKEPRLLPPSHWAGGLNK
eukprot:TRINITY_DN105686_c0_g1_i1.p1 TRINITY_DN105686_c0_g1~~TRINITY_DN105686_c0_g1_i1.p1  ORF type:complete len:234 (-),score=69.75 TRINITY_DN105686_c0_g1_i1:99-749(-)